MSVAADAVIDSTATVKATCGSLPAATCVITVKSSSAKLPVTVTKTVLSMVGTPVPSNGTQMGSLTVDNVITMSVNTDGNNGKIYDSGNEWRLYQTNSPVVTVAAANGYNLVSVSFTFAVSNTGALFYNSENVASGSTVSVSGSSVQFTVGNSGSATNGQVKITSITVVYIEA